MRLGEKIKSFRNKCNKSQNALSIEVGIPQTTLSGWERDDYEPRVTDLSKLATALGVSISDLLDEQPTDNKKPAI